MSTRALYLLLAIVAIIAVSSQVTYTIDVVAEMQGLYPFPPIVVGDPWPSIRGLNDDAKAAGLRAHDRVTAIDGAPVRGQLDVAQRIRSHRPGESLNVAIVRDGTPLEIRVPMPPSTFRPLWY